MALQEFIEKFGGKWKQEKTENFEKYFDIMGVNEETRKVLAEFTPVDEHTIDGDYIVTTSTVGPMTHESRLKLNEEVEEERIGVKMMSTCRYEDGKLIVSSRNVQSKDGKPQVVTNERISDDQYLTTIVVGDNDLVCKIYYKKISN